jgi:two-component system chemotaxis sensor kinase CheA
LELVRLEGEGTRQRIEQIQGTPVYRLRGNLLPLVYLDRALGSDSGEPHSNKDEGRGAAKDFDDAQTPAINIVVLQADDRQFGLVVDGIHDTEEIVVKPLQKQLKGLAVFAGATIMGDGRVALILDVLGLAQKANVISGIRERALSEKPVPSAEPTGDRQTVLLFATDDGGRGAIPLSQVARLEEFPRSSLEHVGTLDVVQYRGEILPLIHVSRALRLRRQETNRRSSARRRADESLAGVTGDPIQVVVYSGAARRVGLVVDRIVDVVEETLVSRSDAHRRGVMFTAVIQGRVTEFLDVESLLGSVAPDLVDAQQTLIAEA